MYALGPETITHALSPFTRKRSHLWTHSCTLNIRCHADLDFSSLLYENYSKNKLLEQSTIRQSSGVLRACTCIPSAHAL